MTVCLTVSSDTENYEKYQTKTVSIIVGQLVESVKDVDTSIHSKR